MFKYSSLRRFLIIVPFFWASNSAFAVTCEEDGFENNDTFSSAATLPLGEHLALCANAEHDWYKLEGLKPGMLHITMEHPLPANLTNGTDDLSIVLRNSSNQVVGSSLNKNTKEEIFYHIARGGDYYIHVYPTNAHVGGANSYDLNVSRSYEAVDDDSNDGSTGNDSLETATQIEDYNVPVVNQKAKDEDWFSVFVPAGSFTVTATYDGLENLSLGGFSSAESRLVNSTGENGVVSVEFSLAEAGTIYLAVVGRTNANYTLSIDHPVKWYKPLNTGAISGSSPTIYDIDGDGKGEILIGSTAYLLPGTRKEDPSKPAALIALEHDGTVKWTQTFPASPNADPVTGHIYNSSSIYSKPAVGDVDGDGELEVVVGVGVDLTSLGSATNPEGVYSPGHHGGVYVLDALTGAIEWSRISLDTIGGSSNVGDGLADGVISSPVICDVDQDGVPEIAWGSWDQRIYLVDGRDGSNFGAGSGGKWPINVHDTNWSSPLCADINDDGLYEILIGGDVTENPEARTLTGGWFHVFDRWGREITKGFNKLIEFSPGSGQFSFLKGKYEEQTIWSSPVAGDLDGDGKLEIAYGTGLFFLRPFGEYIRIWNHGGSEYLKLPTQGRTYATPLFADIDNDGDLEVVATTAKGYVHAWDHLGNEIFATQTYQSGAAVGSNNPIYSSPLAVDMDGDGDLEIIYQQGNAIVAVDKTGQQLTDRTKWGLTNEYFRGTPAIGDLDGDGNLEIITGGSTDSGDAGVVYAFKFGTEGNAVATNGSYNYARRQFRETSVVPITPEQVIRRQQVSGFVTRFYSEVLGRTPEAKGLAGWVNRLLEGDRSGGDVGRGFILSEEFVNQNKTDDEFLNIVYKAFFNRAPDTGGYNRWLGELTSGTSRADVLKGFIGAQEFKNLSETFGITAEFTATQGLRRILVEEFVTRFYNQILLRSPDVAGLKRWTDSLMLETNSGSDIARAFIGSSEFIARGLSDEEYVRVLYRAFFGRSADDGGLAGWTNALNPSTLPVATRPQVRDSFVRSQEFKNLTESYGIKATLD